MCRISHFLRPPAGTSSLVYNKAKESPEKSYWVDRVFGYKPEDPEETIKPTLPVADTPWEHGQWHYQWQENGMLKSVQDPKGRLTTFEYDALGRRTAKISLANKQITRYIYDGNVLLHEFQYSLADRPKTLVSDIGELSFDREEDTTNLTTWVFDEGSFVPSAKIVGDKSYSIISDYLGTPIQAFDENGEQVWERELDIYGKVTRGNSKFVPFLYQGQYYDEETDLAYNRFRYYSPDTGMYISQDPIGLIGNNPNVYAYVFDSNSEVDVLGLAGNPILFGSNFWKSVKSAKTKLRVKGADVFEVKAKTSLEGIKKGDLFHLDTLHLDEIEVYDKWGKHKGVYDLDGNKIGEGIKGRTCK